MKFHAGVAFGWLLAATAFPAAAATNSVALEVRTDRVAYRPGEKVRIDVLVRNAADAPLSGVLKVAVVQGMDDRAEVKQETVKVEPGGQCAVSAGYLPETELWGCEARATLKAENDGPLLSARRVFVVSENPL